MRVRLGAVPEHLDSPKAQGVFYQVSPAQFLLNVEHVARFPVRNGNEIAIERAPEATGGDVRGFLLGSVLGALLRQRGVLPLHASAIETTRLKKRQSQKTKPITKDADSWRILCYYPVRFKTLWTRYSQAMWQLLWRDKKLTTEARQEAHLREYLGRD